MMNHIILTCSVLLMSFVASSHSTSKKSVFPPCTLNPYCNVTSIEGAGCFKQGLCEHTDLIGFGRGRLPNDCLELCQETADCISFTYFTDNGDCLMFEAGCDLIEDACPECVSGDRDCLPQVNCSLQGKSLTLCMSDARL